MWQAILHRREASAARSLSAIELNKEADWPVKDYPMGRFRWDDDRVAFCKADVRIILFPGEGQRAAFHHQTPPDTGPG